MAEISSETNILRDKRKRRQTCSTDSFGSKSKRSSSSLSEDDNTIDLHQTRSINEKPSAVKGRTVHMPGWIVYKCDEMAETLEEWLKKNAPSQIKRVPFVIDIIRDPYKADILQQEMNTLLMNRPVEIIHNTNAQVKSVRDPLATISSSGVCWIAIKRRSDSHTQAADVKALLQAWKSLKSSGQPINQQIIMELARRYNVLEGKWLFYAQTGIMVDQLWSYVCKGIMTQRLPCNMAKVNPVNVSTEKGGPKSHVICVYNHDFTNVDEVNKLEAGLRTIGIECQLFYKPDVYTYLGVYSNNKWGLRPALYQSKYDKTKGKASSVSK